MVFDRLSIPKKREGFPGTERVAENQKTGTDQIELKRDVEVFEAFDEEEAYMPSNAPPTLLEHLWKKTKEKPLISIGKMGNLTFEGVLSTIGAWIQMVRNRHDRHMLNYYARWRLGLQGVTFGIIMYYMYWDARERYLSPYPWHWVTSTTLNTHAPDGLFKTKK